jgi:anti-sigma factor RsiW
MTKIECADVKDLLPESIRRGLEDGDREAVAAHVSSCAPCAEEVAFLERIRAAAVSPPPSLSSDIKAALAGKIDSEAGVVRGRSRRLVGWRLPAAASVVLALGTSVIWQRSQALPDVGPLGQEPFAVVWPSDDADVAGVPMLADLSDDDLALLLEELGG